MAALPDVQHGTRTRRVIKPPKRLYEDEGVFLPSCM
jgi:hypothetical protein